MMHQAGRLVHQDNILIFKENVQGQGFRGETAGHRLRDGEAYPVSRAHPVAGRPGLLIDLDLTILQPAGQAGPAEFRTAR